MKILVTGATGFIGKELTKKLFNKGHDVVILTRDSNKAKKEMSIPCQMFAWNPCANVPPRESFEGIQAIVHLAGESVAQDRWTKEKKARIFDSRIVGTRNLVEALQTFSSGSVRTFICASAIGLYGERGEEILDENAVEGAGFLSHVCTEWEKETTRLDSLRCCVVRIGMVLGKGGALHKMLPVFSLGLGGRIGSGSQWVSWIHIDDLTELLCFLIENENVSGVFNGVAPNACRNRDFVRALGKALRRPTLLPVPSFILRLVMGESAELAVTSQRVVPKRAQEAGFQFSYAEIENATQNVCHNRHSI